MRVAGKWPEQLWKKQGASQELALDIHTSARLSEAPPWGGAAGLELSEQPFPFPVPAACPSFILYLGLTEMRGDGCGLNA